MKQLSSSFGIPFLLALSACGGGSTASKDPAPQNTPPPPAAETPFGYEVKGKDRNGQACTTSEHKYASLHEMCLRLQDASQNNDCAMAERITKFNTSCRPYGYGYQEGRRCRVALLPPAAAVSEFCEYDATQAIKSVEHCAGPSLTNEKLVTLSLQDNVALAEGVSLALEMKYVPEFARTDTEQPSFKLQLKGAGGELSDVFEKVGVGFASKCGSTKGDAYKYVMICAGTWACD